MKLRDHQTFLSLYFEPNAVEVATGEADSFSSVASWQRETKQLGQVATPKPIAALMAKWVMSAKPGTVLDPAAGLGGLLAACRQCNGHVQLVGVERDVETLQRAKATAPRGAKLILADYLKSDAGLFDGIIAKPAIMCLSTAWSSWGCRWSLIDPQGCVRRFVPVPAPSNRQAAQHGKK